MRFRFAVATSPIGGTRCPPCHLNVATVPLSQGNRDRELQGSGREWIGDTYFLFVRTEVAVLHD